MQNCRDQVSTAVIFRYLGVLYDLPKVKKTNRRISMQKLWPNNAFYQEAFSESEQKMIATIDLETNAYDSESRYENWREAVIGSTEKTNDKLFVLDVYEISDVYESLDMRTKISPYAQAELSSLDDKEIAEQGEYNYFWLRNQIVGPYSNYSVCVFGGKEDKASTAIVSGIQFLDKYACIRPAMRINTKNYEDQQQNVG